MDSGVRKSVLTNGLRILTKKMPHVRSVSTGVWVNVGARDESDADNGISHLIEHMIFKGTRRRSAYQIAKEFDAIGGQTNAFTSFENTCFHARVMDTHLETMLDILSDILLNSTFDAEEVERERPVVLQEIGMVEDNPDEYVHLLSSRTYWGDNPLGRSILGTPDTVRSFDQSKIRRFFRRHYQPDQIVVSAAGNLDHDAFVDLAGPVFETLQPGPPPVPRTTPCGRSRIKVHYRELEQVHICLGTQGISIGDPRRYAFSLMNTVLGGNMSSRLFQEIRERRGLAYSVYSFISSYIDTGMFGIYAGVGPRNTLAAINLCLKEMKALKSAPIAEEALKEAKEFTKGNLLLASESTDNQMVRLAQNEICFGRYIPLGDVLKKIEAIRAEDILALAADLFQNRRLAVTLLGPLTDDSGMKDMTSL